MKPIVEITAADDRARHLAEGDIGDRERGGHDRVVGPLLL